MKVSAINSYNYKTISLKQTSGPNFKGKLQLKDIVGKAITKKNLYNFGLISFFITQVLKLSEIETLELINALPVYMMLGAFCITEKPCKLEENIAFQKAESIEEAKKFAEEKLGIKKFKINDLEYANWINEGLTNISNKFKGEVYFPQKIGYCSSFQTGGEAAYNPLLDSFLINEKKIKEGIDGLKGFIDGFPYEYFTEKNLGKGYEDFCEKLAIAYEDIESLSAFEKFALHNSICNVVEMRSEYTNEHNAKNINMYGNIYENEFSTIYHEIGHCFDFKSKSLINAYIDSFKHQKDLKPLVLPDYPKKDTFEFVASTFAGIMQGEKYQDDIMGLFNKLIGFKIPQN